MSSSSYAAAIKAFAINGNQEGFLLLSGLKVDPDLPDTPITPRHSPKATYYSQFWLVSIIRLMGSLFAHKKLSDGQLFQDIAPRRGSEALISSKGSALYLGLHTDLAFHPLAPHFLLLFCLRQVPTVSETESNAYTVVSSIANALRSLSASTQHILRSPSYMMLVDDAFGAYKDSICQPLVYGGEQDPKLRFDHDMAVPINAESREALKELSLALREHAKKILLQPGQVLIIDNRRAVHGRNKFTAKYDGTDRWFQRAYCTTSAEMVESCRGDDYRVDYDFSRRQDGASTVSAVKKPVPKAQYGSLFSVTPLKLLACAAVAGTLLMRR